ncbi:O-antigen ligase family protein [Thermodesulfobacteriota bacterium]
MDHACAIMGGAIPISIVFGTVAFELVVGLIGILWIFRLPLSREHHFRYIVRLPVIAPFVLFFACILISAAANFHSINRFAEDFLFFRYPLCVIALVDISHRLPVFRYLLKGLIISILLCIVNTIMAHMVGYDMIGRNVLRYTGKLKEAKTFSGLSAFASPFFISWAVFYTRLRPINRVLLFGLGLLSLGLVIQFANRNVILAVLAGNFWVLFVFLKRRYSISWAGVFILVLSIGTGIYLYVNNPYLGSFYDRLHIWKVSWQIWTENPILGVSTLGYMDAYAKTLTSETLSQFAYIAPDGNIYNGMVNGSIEIATHAHNLFFMLVSTTGILGLSVFIWLMWDAVRLVVKDLEGWRVGLIAWPIVFVVIGIAGANIYDAYYTSLFSYFLVLILCSDRIITLDHQNGNKGIRSE